MNNSDWVLYITTVIVAFIEFQTDNKKYRGLIAWTLGAYNVLAKTLDEEKITTRIWFKDLYEDIFNYKVRVTGNSFENPDLLK